ncbi:hypothetical protein AX15_001370 [Amanita polypyramis BW_CC]|nr:hypothetical protein AX15_001370 [Amanita polypyramis BW_CC]
MGLNPRCLSYPQPTAPTQCLPKLVHLARTSTFEVKNALDNLRALYFPTGDIPPSTAPVVCDKLSREGSITLFKTLVQPAVTTNVLGTRIDEGLASVPDSGYASAEEDGEFDPGSQFQQEKEDELSILRADPLERMYALRWLTGFVGRSDVWFSSSCPDSEKDDEDEPGSGPIPGRAELLEEAAKLISAFSDDASASEHNDDDDDQPDGSILRVFSFPTPAKTSFTGCMTEAKTEITVQLNDAPLSSSDHTSVGLQSWGSSIILAERLCANPEAFSILPKEHHTTSEFSQVGPSQRLRILELGAGTGLLSIATSKIVQLHHSLGWTDVVATDYHPDVLTNLALNIGANANIQDATLQGFEESLVDVVVGQPGSNQRTSVPPVSVCEFDWEHPDYTSAPFNELFDVILAADVIYHPLHSTWIKKCVERLLRKPGKKYSTGEDVQRGVFWLIIPIRMTGRHEGMHCTVEKLFPGVGQDQVEGGTRAAEEGDYEMAILEMEEVEKREGTGRADESGYRLYKIGWIPRA